MTITTTYFDYNTYYKKNSDIKDLESTPLKQKTIPKEVPSSHIGQFSNKTPI